MTPGSAHWFSQNRMRLGILLIYVAVTGTALHQHAMWRDEMQAWLIARDSPNLATLLHTLRYEGHPALWYLFLMPLTRVTRNPAAMQMLNLAISAATVAIVLWRAPFTRLERALFPFGYFVFYEYAVKSRAYGLGFLLLVIVCTLWSSRRGRPVLLAAVLALLANVHLFFLILSISAAGAWWLSRITAADAMPAPTDAGRQANRAAALILLSAWLLAAATIRPPPDPGYAAAWFVSLDITRMQNTLNTLSALFTPQPEFWATLAALAMLLMIAWRWKAAPAAALFYVLSVSGILLLFYLKVPSQQWLSGILFLAFIATNWIARRHTADVSAPGATPRHLVPLIMFCAVLAIQLPFGLAAIRTDWVHPLSNGYKVASFITARGWAQQPMAAVPDETMTPIAGYLGINRIYYGNGERWGSFTVWDLRRKDEFDPGAFLKAAAALGPAVTLIIGANRSIDAQLLSHYGFTKIAQFYGARSTDENYTIYRRVQSPP